MKSMKKNFKPIYNSLPIRKKLAIHLAEASLQEADRTSDEQLKLDWISSSKEIAQIVLGILPVTGEAIALYELVIGKSIHGKELGTGSRLLAAVSLAGFSKSRFSLIGKALDGIKRIFFKTQKLSLPTAALNSETFIEKITTGKKSYRVSDS